MNPANIQTFLCVARCGSISAAAAMLYISQSAVSTRLRQLEETLGAALVERRQGSRSIVLTARGEAFLPLAERWMALSTETAAFAQQPLRTALTVAGPDSLNHCLLEPLFRELTNPVHSLALRVRTRQSQEIFSLVENREVDVGLAFNLFRSENVRCRRLLSEKMVLLWAGPPIQTQTLRSVDLDPNREIFLAWSQDYQLWHNSIWPTALYPRIQVDTVGLAAPHLMQGDCWCIAPLSVAKAFTAQKIPIQMLDLEDTPPDRVCYLLTHRDPHSRAADAAALFQDTLLTYLRNLAAHTPGIVISL